MWTNFQTQLGFDVLKSGASYFAAANAAESAKEWQDYNNTITRIQNAQNQNALTVNETMAQERSVAQEFAINKSEYATKAAAEVSAAAMGVTGNSVNAVLFDIGHNAAEARARNRSDLQDKMLQIATQRDASNMGAQLQQDHTYIPQPDLVSTMLGFGAKTVENYANQRNSGNMI